MGFIRLNFLDNQSRRGVTLLELLVALALSVLLLSVTSGVIKSMMQKKKVFADQLAVQPWRRELIDHLRSDILRATEMRLNARTLELAGFCGHDPVTGEPVQRPVYVRWQLIDKDRQVVLVRIEQPQDTMDDTLPQVQLVSINVAALSVGTFVGSEYEEQTDLQTFTASPERTEQGEWGVLPKVVKLVVTGTRNEILADELIFR